MCPSQALQGGGCVSDFLHSQSPREPPRTHCFRPLAPLTLPTTHCLRLAPWRRTHRSTWHSIEMSSLLRKRFFKQTYVTSSSSSSSLHCVLLSRIEFYVSCRFAISKYIPNISMLRGSWDKVSRVEGIKIIYQSQPLEAYKYTCTMEHSFCGKTEVLQIFKRDLFNTQPPGKWPHGPIHSACGTEGAPGHWRGHTYYHDNHVEIGQKYVDE